MKPKATISIYPSEQTTHIPAPIAATESFIDDSLAEEIAAGGAVANDSSGSEQLAGSEVKNPAVIDAHMEEEEKEEKPENKKDATSTIKKDGVPENKATENIDEKDEVQQSEDGRTHRHRSPRRNTVADTAKG